MLPVAETAFPDSDIPAPQIADKPWARRKGLGKFLLMLTEMISKKAGFGGARLELFCHSNSSTLTQPAGS